MRVHLSLLPNMIKQRLACWFYRKNAQLKQPQIKLFAKADSSSRYLLNDINKQVKLKSVFNVHSTSMNVQILRNAAGKRARAYHLKWLHWHNFFTVERCQASALLNAHVSLSFSLDGQMNMLQVSSYTGQNPRTTKKLKQIS